MQALDADTGDAGDGEPAPKQQRRKQLTQQVVDGVGVCRFCGDPLTGRQVFCKDKTPKCMQAYHRAQQEKEQQAAAAASLADARQAAFQEGMQHQREMQPSEELLTGDSDDQLPERRIASSGWEDVPFCNKFNAQLLERGVDGWQNTTLTLPISLRGAGALLQPFLWVSRLPRESDEDKAYVLLRNGKPWTTTLKAGRKGKMVLGGFDGYEASQHASDSVVERDTAQRRSIVMFNPWVVWADTFPQYLLPEGFTDSALWAATVQDEILKAVKKLFSAHTVPWDATWEILYIHVLDQSVGASRFRMHRDVEEDSNKFGKGYRLRVYHTVVLLLDKGPKKVPALFVAGAEHFAKYRTEMTGHVFNAALFHTTQPMCDGECSGVKLGVFIGKRF